MKQVKPSFFTNFYFSQFFGSRILGLIYLIILIYLIFKFKEYLVKKFNIYSFFVVLILFSYSIPLLYTFFIGPVLLGKFLIYLLIPIISIIAFLTFKIKNKILKYFIIFILVNTTVNHILYENSFKQFYKEIYPTKPQIGEALELINTSGTKSFILMDNKAKEKNSYIAYENYILNYKKSLRYNLDYFNQYNINNLPESIWVIHIKDAYKEFYIPKNFENYKIIDKKFLNNLDLVKLEK